MNKQEIIENISNILFDMFVINTRAIALQQKDGKYATTYIPVSQNLIKNMIISKGSMGCYQQGYRSKYIKWICLDFDCKDKTNDDLFILESLYINKLIDVLEKHKISYLKEFSGRRGIHIWLLFDTIITKKEGYDIINKLVIESEIDEIKEDQRFGLDLFPQTDSWINNIVGKQVKLPLSTHKMGGRSYFFEGQFRILEDHESIDFFHRQQNIISAHKKNSINVVKETLNIESIKSSIIKYKKYNINDSIQLNYKEIIDILSETKIYKDIFTRMTKGIPQQIDWYVLFGTFSPFSNSVELLTDILSKYPLFDEKTTNSSIRKLKGKYHPPTFGYLSRVYNIDIEENIDSNLTGFEYILSKKDIHFEIINKRKEQKKNLEIKNTIEKEKNYLLNNDEVPDITIYNNLLSLRNYDIHEIVKIIEKAKTSLFEGEIKGYRISERLESSEKIRKMVALSAIDRVVTTQIALKIASNYSRPNSSYLFSYSYRPALLSTTDIFFPWFSSWDNYISQLKSIINVPFYSNYGIFYIDLKHYYDSIDFLTVYKLLEKDLDEDNTRLMKYLISYNDKIMSLLNNGLRIGVPQGPAYARIISEIFLNRVMSEIIKEYDGKLYLYKYVDDMVFICEPNINTKSIYTNIINKLSNYGLSANLEKSCYFNKIQNLTDEEKSLILHLDSFNYDLRSTEDGYLLTTEERIKRFNEYNYNNDFDINKLGYYFSSESSDIAKMKIFNLHKIEILSSNVGRGSNYRRFYEYVFSIDNNVEILAKEDLFKLIPINSINFSNYLSTMYFSLENKYLSKYAFNIICSSHLEKIRNNEELSAEDNITLEALLYIRGKNNQ